ncbi:MAG: Crp/Fnr family transcriptional regulator [Rhodocyclaceae bacterium]|nr:Crp/Fnr family transcriptional regulator [Rhodocyclaceae bacterium]
MIFYQLYSQNPQIVKCKAGEALFEPGDPGEAMYVLAFGSAKYVDMAGHAEAIAPGGVVGEACMVEAEPYRSRVVAVEDSEFVRIDRQRFIDLVSRMPEFALEVLRVAARRLQPAASVVIA